MAPNQAKILIDDDMGEELRSSIEKARPDTPTSESMTRQMQ